MIVDSKERFTDRVDDYVRWRPGYPPAIVTWLRAHGVDASWVVADVGAGTGISAKMFLDAGHSVIAVEPNQAMRGAIDPHPRLTVVAGSAEATTLPQASVDLVSAAQAFHWFDAAAVRSEWRRILRSGGLVAIYWNWRRETGTPFLEGYERLLREHTPDYGKISARHQDPDAMRRWFGAGLRGETSIASEQHLDREGLRGRLLSSSYAPKEGQIRHAPMMRALDALFEATAADGQVTLAYDTHVFLGTV